MEIKSKYYLTIIKKINFRQTFLILSFFSLTTLFSNDSYLLIQGVLPYNSSLFENGDIIFRRGRSFVSRMVLLTDNSSNFSHSGIIYKNNNEIFVIHSVPGEEKGEPDIVKKENLSTFLRNDRAEAFAIYRIKELQKFKIKIAVNYALTLANNKTPFDGSFDYRTDDEIYCTELVWKAFLKGGIDLVEDRFEKLNFALGNGPYILPGTLLNSPTLQLIYSYTSN